MLVSIMTMTMTRTKSITPAAAASSAASSLSASMRRRRRRRRKRYTESAAVSLCWVFAMMMMVLGVSVMSDRHNNNGNTAGVVHALKILGQQRRRHHYGSRSTVTTATRSPASTATPVAAVLALRGGGNGNSPAAVRADRPDPAAPIKTATAVSNAAATAVASTRGGGGGDGSRGHTRPTTTTSMTLLAQNPLVQGIVGLLGGYVSYRFAIWLPLVVTPQAATGTYIPARYQYETTGVDHKFCASPITYLTDYMVLAALCVVGTRLKQPHSTRSSTTKTNKNKSNSKNNTIAAHGYQEAVRIRAVGILLTYGIQFLYGGTAHAVLIPLRDRRSFRIVWSLVVSAVCVSGGVIGSLATTLLTGPPGAHNTQQPRFLPQTAFWIGYSVFLTGYTILGNLSYQRPAVDTVVAGTSQTLPTFYLMGVMIHYWKQTQTHHRTHNTRQKTMMPRMTVTTGLLWSVILGFGLNGVLLPTYALVVQYMPTITVPMLNAFLHSWLCLCYIAQGLVLYKVVELSSSAQ